MFQNMINFNKIGLLVLLGALFLSSCSSEPDKDTFFSFKAPVLETEEILSIGDTEEHQIGEFWHFRVDSNGTIYVPDNGLKTIHVFNPEGSLITTIGREGRGPGEFNAIVLSIDENNQLLAFDWNLARLQIFTPESDNAWEVSSTLDITREGMAFPVGVQGAGENKLFVQYVNGFSRDENEDSQRPFAKVINYSGETIHEQLAEFTQNDMVTIRTDVSVSVRPHPFGSESHTWYSNNTIHHAWGGEMKIFRTQIRDSGIVTDTLISVRTQPVPFTTAELNEVFERDGISDEFQRAIRETDITYKPEIRSLIVDDENHIWIKRHAAENEPNWFVFSETGELLHSVILDERFTIQHIVDNHIYGIDRDEFDVAKVSVLRIL